MKKSKVLYKNITTQQGETTDRCPACSGECIEMLDFTNAKGGDMIV